MHGLAAAPLIKKVAPSAEILIVTGHATPSVLREAFGAGARGFLSKNDIATDLIQAVRAVHSRQRFLSTAVKIKLQPVHLTREGYVYGVPKVDVYVRIPDDRLHVFSRFGERDRFDELWHVFDISIALTRSPDQSRR